MKEVFRPYFLIFVLVFFDEILIYSKTWEDYIAHLRLTLEILRVHKLYAKELKCQFGCNKVEYLGHVTSKHGVAADPNKIGCMVSWLLPTTINALRGFLGLTGY